jgi:hypothetical protein
VVDGVRHRLIDGVPYIRAEDLINEMDLLTEQELHPHQMNTVLFIRNYIAGIAAASKAGSDPVA